MDSEEENIDNYCKLLLQGKLSSSKTCDILVELRGLAKGNENVKVYIWNRIREYIVWTLDNTSLDMKVRVESGRLLRSITVCDRAKYMKEHCHTIIKTATSSTNRALKLSMAAVIWNLSALSENRPVIVSNNGLKVLKNLLLTGDASLQREAAGALRNMSIDEDTKKLYLTSGVFNAIMDCLYSVEEVGILSILLCSIKNLAASDYMHPYIGSVKSLEVLQRILSYGSSSSSGGLDSFVFSILENMIDNETIRARIGHTPDILSTIIYRATCEDQSTAEKCGLLLNSFNLETDVIDSEIENIQEAIANNAIMTMPVDYNELLERLDLKGSVNYEEIELQKKIGEGVYGDVWFAEYHGFPVACKIIKKSLNPRDAEKTLEELRIMKKLKHPNIVLLMGACLNHKRQICIVTEYAGRGDLKHVAPKVKDLSKRLRFAVDMAKGLSWLHAMGIVHRDLKLANILVLDDYSIKICDFGLSMQYVKGVDITRFGGNVKYSAPEILQARYHDEVKIYAYCEKTDVYSFGLMLWELLTLNPLFSRPKKFKGKEGLAEYVLEGNRPKIMDFWPSRVQDLLSNCWNVNAENRPDFQSIIQEWDSIETQLLCPCEIARRIVYKLWNKDRSKKYDIVEIKNILSSTCMESDTYFDYNEEAYTLLKSVMCLSKHNNWVSYKQFCHVIGWFGPLSDGDNCAGFINRIRDIHSKRYFHAFTPGKILQNKLRRMWERQSKKRVIYAVRLSISDCGEYILAIIDKNGNHSSQRILNVKGKLWIERVSSQEFENWEQVRMACKNKWELSIHLPVLPDI
eukprot:TRINITY_DN10673_c0_g1_i1.p1 TRINITY_DN10673_c0_g1~~TRINITY_DN10673_c0_g1_i1.p1  ORF type:complete len:813 (+),score=144.14 TRINITY_DN10673_c0_g1_i1:38-2440(+)